MRAVVLMFSFVVSCFGFLTGVPSDIHAQLLGPPLLPVPDLVVSSITCKAPNSNLVFTLRNMGEALPTGWNAVADVYIGTTKVGSIDLRYPTAGSIATRGGNAWYVTKTIITKSSTVKVFVDPLNTVKEYSDSNNSKTMTLAPCPYTSTPSTSLSTPPASSSSTTSSTPPTTPTSK